MYGQMFYEKLREGVQGQNRGNWYAHYQLSLLHLEYQEMDLAKQELLASWNLEETAWACHALGSLYTLVGNKEEAGLRLAKGIEKRPEDLSYVKEGFRLLLSLEAYGEVVRLYPILSDQVQRESRVLFDYYAALGETENGSRCMTS